MDIIDIPDEAGERLRATLGLQPADELRISYVTGTGDVVGTYGYWLQGQNDPRVPVVTYSAMFYELVTALGAKAQVITSYEPPKGLDGIIEFDRASRKPSRGRIDKVLNEVKYTKDCIKLIESFDPHIIVAASDFQALGWRRLKHRGKLILSAHNTYWPMGRRDWSIKQRLKIAIVKRQGVALDGAVCTSQECKRQIQEITNGRISGNVEYPQIVRRYPVGRSSSVASLILYLGRIEEDKGVFMLVKAFEELTSDDSNTRLIIAGSGTGEDRLKRTIGDTNRQNIEFKGLLDSADVHRVISEADLIVCPTTSAFNEGLALVGFEGAAHGVPSLLSSVVPAADLLKDGCRVFEADNFDALKSSLEQLMSDQAAFEDLRESARQSTHLLYDRKRSWGSVLYETMLIS